jgi:hypothetical protein
MWANHGRAAEECRKKFPAFQRYPSSSLVERLERSVKVYRLIQRVMSILVVVLTAVLSVVISCYCGDPL